MESHDEFLELCALSTSGELTEPERIRLQAHLADCPECRQALKEFEDAVGIGIPFLASGLSVPPQQDSLPVQVISKKSARRISSAGELPIDTGTGDPDSAPESGERGFVFSGAKGVGQSPINWTYAWLPIAACILLTIALGVYAYRIGKGRSEEMARTVSPSSDVQIEALEGQISDASHERAELQSQLRQRDKLIADLKHELEAQSAYLNEAKSAQANLAQSVETDETERQHEDENRSQLEQRLSAAQASLARTHAELDSLREQSAQDKSRADSLAAQVNDLNGELRDREHTIGKQDDLLAHDRDVRELMGARDLYIAEIYDVSRDGVTQKPYGRVFYTKGKSLVFYAYDLDQEAGAKKARTFQAWGQRGPDREEALNLGIFYEDSSAKKRWVLKFDDAKTLEQINAVFVTIEPNGGSEKPSGKPLLFTYLKIEPNHP